MPIGAIIIHPALHSASNSRLLKTSNSIAGVSCVLLWRSLYSERWLSSFHYLMLYSFSHSRSYQNFNCCNLWKKDSLLRTTNSDSAGTVLQRSAAYFIKYSIKTSSQSQKEILFGAFIYHCLLNISLKIPVPVFLQRHWGEGEKENTPVNSYYQTISHYWLIFLKSYYK